MADDGNRRRRPEPLMSDARPKRTSSDLARAKAAKGEPRPRRRSDAARHPLVLLMNFALLIVMFGGGLALALTLYGRSVYYGAGPLSQESAVLIPRGTTTRAIASGLANDNVITDATVFLVATRLLPDISLKAGEYLIPARASMADVVEIMTEGRTLQHALTFAEGLTSAQIVVRLNEAEVLAGSIEAIPAEGSLLPDTYLFERGTTRSELIETMREAQDDALTAIWEARDPEVPIGSPEELVVLASIVEKETALAEERGLVAGVFVNRLNQDMKLQSDPTILYGLYGGDAWAEPRTIYQSDLERPNPYNTYQIDGLPPGPIANPGRAAMEAVANPETTTALFFVADGTGGHAFADTYEEHQQNVARWRAIERDRRGADAAATR